MTRTSSTSFVPTPEQAAAIGHPLSPLLVVAGAGTGKTSVMAERILRVVTDGLATPDQVLGLTFTNKAALELKDRVLERLPRDADVTVTTYHGFCASVVAEHALELGLDDRTELLGRAQAWQLLFTVFDEFRFEHRSSYDPSVVVNQALVLASRCADHLVDVDAVELDAREMAADAKWVDARRAGNGRAELCQVVRAYDRRKRERNLIDWGDQIRLAVRLLEAHPEIAAGLREQHPVVLLDEYQDTNFAQRRLLQLVYPPGSAVTAVGDDMQSIYAFRGAHLENILRFEEHFPPVEERPLTVNRRSGPSVVDLANRIQGEVPDAREKALRALDDAPATVIECFLAADDAKEAATIADDIAAVGAPWRASAVLCRKRKLIPEIAAALEVRGVPVEVVGSSGLLARPEVVDVVAWLEVVADVGSTVALLRLLRGPRYRIGWRDLAALARASAPGPLGLALADPDAVPDLSAEARTRLAELRAERAVLARVAARVPVLDLCETIVERTGLWAATGSRGRENLLRFLDLAERFAPVEGDPGLPAFVEYLHLLDESEEDVAEAHLSGADAVRVMTIHQAKGLEFPNVWVPGLGHRTFPDGRGGENPVTQADGLPWWLRTDTGGMPHWSAWPRKTDLDEEVRRRHLEEEWRLFYVACTRAERRLVLSAAQWYSTTTAPAGPSSFYEWVSAPERKDLVTERFRDEPPERDPKVAALERRRAALAAPGGGGRSRGGSRPAATAAPSLFTGLTVAPPVRRAPTALSVTGLVSYARCPRQFYWSVVRPLPRRASAAAAVGTEVHRWIEERSGRQLPLFAADVDADGEAGDRPAAGVVAGLRASFLASEYAGADPERVEAPFVLAVGDRLVRGRIDAVYRSPDGRLDLVDFKTGRPPAAGDAGGHVQLDLYALAAVDTWGASPEELRTTYCYLRADGGPPVLDRADWDGARLERVRVSLAERLVALGAGRFGTTPGGWCDRCDYLSFCPAGRNRDTTST